MKDPIPREMVLVTNGQQVWPGCYEKSDYWNVLFVDFDGRIVNEMRTDIIDWQPLPGSIGSPKTAKKVTEKSEEV